MQPKLLNEHSDKHLFARQLGKGEPVLILHGLLGSSGNWATVAAKLAPFYTVFSLDLRNHGRSFHSDHFDYRTMAGDVQRFIAQQGLKTVSIIGHSMGGKTAMQFAQLYPERLHKLVVVDIAPKAYPPRNLETVDVLRNLDLTSVSRLSQAEERLQKAIPDKSERQSHLKNLKRSPDGSYHWLVNLEAVRNNYPSVAAAVKGGTYAGSCLFIRGSESDYILDTDWNHVLEQFPRARLETIAKAGHWVHIQAREKFTRTVLDYLADGGT